MEFKIPYPLKVELDLMLEEHKTIVVALEKLSAKAASLADCQAIFSHNQKENTP